MNRLAVIMSLGACVCLLAGCAGPAVDRRADLVEASIRGTHAYQVELQRKSKNGGAPAFEAANLDDAQLDALVKAHQALLSADRDAVKKWSRGEPSTFDASKSVGPLLQAELKLDPSLPVNAATAVLSRHNAAHVSAARVRALANLLQIVLEVNRDGGVLQDQLAFDRDLGLLTGPSDLGIPDSAAGFTDLTAALTQRSCKAPFGTSRGNWHIALRKIQNWSLKYRGIGPDEYAGELLARPDGKPLIARMQAMPAQKVLVIGHSYTMKEHWATLAPFNEIVAAAFAKVNPRVTFHHMGIGGMTASQARAKFLDRALALRPSQVLIVTVVGSDADAKALAEMTRKLRAIGARVGFFDRLHPDPSSWINPKPERFEDALDAGLELIPVSLVMSTHPDRARFIALDGVHMTDPWHKMIAAEWLKWVVGE